MRLNLLDTINGVEVFGLSLNMDSIHSRFDEFHLYESNPEIFSLDNISLMYRSVSYEKWDYIKENGVDVSPIDSVIYCDSLDKASEYGSWPKVIMGFDPNLLDRTYREVDSSVEETELQILLEKFPTKEASVDGAKLWLSRLDVHDPRRTSAYEIQYAKWIPEEPWKALKLIILADLNDRDWDL